MAKAKMVAVMLHQQKKEKGKFVTKGSSPVFDKVSILSRDYVEHFNLGSSTSGKIYIEQEKETKAYYKTRQGKMQLKKESN
ncbi:MAG: hypothetical protein ACUZ8H_16035 [Candidatus Anammoxibacter sp.]